MPSSISNSENQNFQTPNLKIENEIAPAHRAPAGQWLKTWLLTAALTITAFIAWETFWRSKDFTPNFTDTPTLWHHTRSQLSENNTNAIVILGSSRVQTGLDQNVLKKELDLKDCVLLAKKGESPMNLLRHLALETKYKGIVLCGIAPHIAFKDQYTINNNQFQPTGATFQLIKNYKKWNVSFANKCDFYYEYLSHRYLASKNEQLNYHTLLRNLRGKVPIIPTNRILNLDRTSRIDYLAREIPKHPSWSRYKPIGQLDPLITQVSKWCNTIHKRGGQVIFIRMPSAEPYQSFEKQSFPKEKFWDKLTTIPNTKNIHFEEYESLKKFNCPDGSHLDMQDIKNFTKELTKILKQKLSKHIQQKL